MTDYIAQTQTVMIQCHTRVPDKMTVFSPGLSFTRDHVNKTVITSLKQPGAHSIEDHVMEPFNVIIL
jgi:hypothetical protein